MLKNNHTLAIVTISLANSFYQINSSILSPLIYIICIHMLHKSDSDLGLVHFLTTIGYLLFSYMCGRISDWLKVRRTILLSVLISCAGCILIYGSMVMKMDGYYVFLLAMLVSGFSNTLFQTTFNSRLPEILDRKDLALGNSVLQLTNSLGAFLGPIFVSLCYALGKTDWIIMIMLVINLMNLILVFYSMPSGNVGNASVAGKESRSEFGFLQAVTYIFHKRGLVYILISTLLINFAFALIQVIQILHMVRVWEISEAVALTITSYTSIASVLGSLLAPLLMRKSHSIVIIWGILLPGFAAVFLLLPHMNFLSACVILMCLWISRSIGAVIRITMQQSLIDRSVIGSVTGAMMTITWGINPLGNVVSGYLSQSLGSVTVMVAAVVCLLAAAVCMIGLVREM